MRRYRITSTAAVIYISLMSATGWGQSVYDNLLLVCSAESSLASLTNGEARKIFLGVPTEINDVRIMPVLNDSDPIIMEVFLQKVIFMSKPEYERQLLSRVFRVGGRRPPVYKTVQNLAAELQAYPGAVSYLWSEQVKEYPGLKSLGVIWAYTNE